MKIQVLLFVFSLVYSSPLQRDKDPYSREKLQERLRQIQGSLEEGRDTTSDGEYTRYLKELMANHPELADQFKKMAPETIAKRLDGRFAHKNKNVRSQIDELQRMNLDRMRQVKNGIPEANNRSPYNNPKFGHERGARLEDVESRIKDFQKVQKELDEIRKQRFHSFEKRVEDARMKKMKDMDEAHRLKEEERLEALSNQHKEHAKMLYPASRKQLEDVWEHQDGLKDEPFDAKTFFYLHDKNGDSLLDFYEIEALFVDEIKKVYGENTDSMIVEEELNEMREHVFQEVDTNSDGFVSFKEFVAYTNDQKFDVDEEWKPLEERDQVVLSQEDMDLAYDYGDEDYHYQELQQQQHFTDEEEEGQQLHAPSEGVPLEHEGMQRQAQGQQPHAPSEGVPNPAHSTPAQGNPQPHIDNNERSIPTEAHKQEEVEKKEEKLPDQIKEHTTEAVVVKEKEVISEERAGAQQQQGNL